MLKTVEDVSATKKRLKIEIPAENIETEIQKAFKDIQKKSKFPGFRPGKAPMNMVEKKFAREVEAEVLDKMIPEFYVKALKEADITPVSRPIVEESFDFKRNAPLSMTVTVEVRPNVDNLNYEGIAVKEIPVEVKEEEIDSTLQKLAEEKAAYEEVDDAAVVGDLVTVDYTVKEDGSVSKDVVLKIGSGPYPQEFFDGLTGKRKDEGFSVEATFPADSQTPFAGRKVGFDIKIKDIKRRGVTSVDDEFAKDLGLDNLQALKDKVRENMLRFKNADAEKRQQREILDKLIETHDLEVPDSLLNAEMEGIISDIKASGKDNRPDDALKEELRPNAVKSVKASLLLELIGEKEGVKVTEDEVKEEIIAIAQRFYMTPENVMKYYISRDGSLEGLKGTVFEKKVLGLLLSRANKEKGE